MYKPIGVVHSPFKWVQDVPIQSVAAEGVEGSVEVRCLVRAQARTGVEMEALIGVSVAMNTLWDMVKYLEKNEQGQYPATMITDIRVIKKEKGGEND